MPFYPAQEIKVKLNILELFKKDGHDMKRSGSEYVCLCPFHEEITPSCTVSEEKGFFHCFGCEIGGDLIKYWEFSRDCNFKEACESLGPLAGMSPEPSHYTPATRKPSPSPKLPQKAPIPLSNKALTTWAKACTHLANSSDEIERIARWRGFSPELIQWAAECRLIGLLDYMNAPREAFIVKAPTINKNSLTSTSIHIRLAPSTSGNFTDKASWRFTPTGQKSWPFIIGTTHEAKTIYLTEGQWDALALCEIMGWHLNGKVFQDICVVGLRGASSGKLLNQYTINPKATIIAFTDSDDAGDAWMAPGGLLDQLQPEVKAVYGFKPDQKNSDLNERLQAGLTQKQLLSAIPDYPAVKSLGELVQASEKLKER